MEAKAVQSLHFSTMVYGEKLGRRGPSGPLKMSGAFLEQKKKAFVSARLQAARPSTRSRRSRVHLEVSCSYNSVPASILESESFHAPVDEEWILKSKSQEIEPYLNGRCIYLVGMMGSGKTTVGKILSQVLSYSFFDSDDLVEEEVDGTSVADIFKHYGEAFFRDKETEVLQKLSMMHRHVISTGGGAVVRPINWKYMHQGISVWLDVPVEALARRITAVGTNSRPLLHCEAGDAYTRDCVMFFYADIVAKLGQRDVSELSPTIIAVEALEQIKGFLKGEDGR